MGAAIRAGDLNTTDPLARQFVDWLRRLFRRPGGAAADGPGAVAATRPGDDQAAGGSRGTVAVDLLPHVPGEGITAYLSNGGTLEHAQRIVGHASPKTTKLYDRTADTISVDEIERIVI